MSEKQKDKIFEILRKLSNLKRMRLFQEKTFDWEFRLHAFPNDITREDVIEGMYRIHKTENQRYKFIMKYSPKRVYYYSDAEKEQLIRRFGKIKQ
jgi:hypothetical protein